MHEAAMVGNLKFVKKHAAAESAKKRALDEGDARGCTAFHLACAGGHAECAKALLKAGCDALRTNNAGETGWELARQSGRGEVMAALRKYGKKGHQGLQLQLALEEAMFEEAAAAAEPAEGLVH
jgi:ankyrin repeat protein